MVLCVQVMRHSPVLPLLLPHSTTCDTSLNGYVIPRDTMVFFNLYSLCRDEQLWENPQEFQPERFVSREGKLKAANLLQFGLGKRRCIGEDIGRLQVCDDFRLAAVLSTCRHRLLATSVIR